VIDHSSVKPDPDYTRLIKAIGRNGNPNYVPCLELVADPEFIAAYLEETAPITWNQAASHDQWKASIDQKIRFWYTLGYDAIWQGGALDFPRVEMLKSVDTAQYSRNTREWFNESKGCITSWAEFEAYPWHTSHNVDYFPVEYMAAQLPQGMGIFGEIGGVYESLSWMMGYETLCFALHDQPDLVGAICERIAQVYIPVARSLAQMDRVIGLWMGDDLGYNTSTLISTAHLRRYIFPIQREIAAVAHEYGKPFLLHSCGKLSSIMEDLIDFVEIDAKHSFQDIIEPVEHFCNRYHDRICTIGGMDIDLLARGSEEQVRQRARQILETCAPSKAYMLGSGNTLANYIPIPNFLAMLDEARRFNRSGS
jgi:uroporphyrinogen decarboxylase